MPQDNRSVRDRLGPIGVWLGGPEHSADPAEAERSALRQLDRIDVYGSVWTGEPMGTGGKDIVAHLGVWLAATKRLMVGAGIANVWSRSPESAQAAGATLAEAFPGRFIHGIGIGHPFQAAHVGTDYGSPLAVMGDYLRRMDEEAARSQVPAAPFARVIAAVGPRMLELAAQQSDGAHPYFVPVEHTAHARRRLGPGPLLIPEQSVLVDPDQAALDAYRARLSVSAQIAHYRANLLRFGLTAHDLDTASDKFLNAVGVAGSPETVAERIVAHLRAGADHVLISPFGDLPSVVHQLKRLAPALEAALEAAI
jgi:probable F420-dependent oxidoreductase